MQRLSNDKIAKAVEIISSGDGTQAELVKKLEISNKIASKLAINLQLAGIITRERRVKREGNGSTGVPYQIKLVEGKTPVDLKRCLSEIRDERKPNPYLNFQTFQQILKNQKFERAKRLEAIANRFIRKGGVEIPPRDKQLRIDIDFIEDSLIDYGFHPHEWVLDTRTANCRGVGGSKYNSWSLFNEEIVRRFAVVDDELFKSTQAKLAEGLEKKFLKANPFYPMGKRKAFTLMLHDIGLHSRKLCYHLQDRPAAQGRLTEPNTQV